MHSNTRSRGGVRVTRRRLLEAAGAAVLTGATGNALAAGPLRWGIVGTGAIANSMAGVIASVPDAELAAVSSRRLASAEEFAARHGAARSFDSWAAMSASDAIDAVYVATPTSVREEISLAAAAAGKHVLAEKPFASVASVSRIAEACRSRGLVFMDGTHFGHHPRTVYLRERMTDMIGPLRSVDSVFQFPLKDRGNIRYNPSLEPLGAIGDAGWYNMRALAEYLPQDVEPISVASALRRDAESGAIVRGSGVLRFSNEVVATWTCGFDTGAVETSLKFTGDDGVIVLDDFAANNADGSADITVHRGSWEEASTETYSRPSDYTSRQLMFQDFAAIVNDTAAIERSIDITLRTQALLDAAFEAAISDEAAA